MADEVTSTVTEEAPESTQGQSMGPDGGTQGVENTEQSQQSSQPVGSDFDRSAWAYKVRGQILYPKDRNHLVQLAQMGHDYGERVAELKRQSEEIRKQGESLSKYRQLEEAFGKNPDFARKVWDLQHQFSSGKVQQNGQGGDEELPPWARSVMDENKTLKEQLEGLNNRYQEWENSRADSEIKKEIDSLKSNHSEHDWDTNDGNGSLLMRVLKHAHENKFPSLEAAYRDLHWDTREVDLTARVKKQMDEERKQNKKRGMVMDDAPTGPKQSEGPVDIRKLSYAQLSQLAAKEMT